MTSRPVTSSIRGSFGGRAGSGVCMCVSMFVCAWPWRGPLRSSIERGGRQAGRGLMGPPFSAILGFCLLTAAATPDLMSNRVCVYMCVCMCVQCLYFLSILFMAISQVDRTITHSHLFLTLYKSLPVCVCLLSLHPSLSFNFFILPLLSLLLSPLPVSARPSFYSIPLSLPSSLPPVRWERGERGGGVLASLSGASGNLISQQRQTERGRVGSNLSFSDCTFNTEVIF